MHSSETPFSLQQALPLPDPSKHFLIWLAWSKQAGFISPLATTVRLPGKYNFVSNSLIFVDLRLILVESVGAQTKIQCSRFTSSVSNDCNRNNEKNQA